MGRRRLLIGFAAFVVVVLVVVALVFWPRGTNVVTHEDAVAGFRALDTQPTPSVGTEVVATTPPPGVYTFAAEGEESVKLGPLPAETRPLPDTITAVVAPPADGCFSWTVNFFAEHTEETRWCTAPDSIRLAGHTKHQRIGALSPTATMVCDPDAVRAPGATSTSLRCQLTLDGGPASIHAVLEGAATRQAPTTVDIGGRSVAATPVQVRYAVSGDLTGSWDETVWWAPDMLPVKVERAIDLRGPATFSERSTLQLVALEPTT